MIALPNAVDLWNNPRSLVSQWNNDKSKSKQENLISRLVGKVGNVVDLGCGSGRFSKVLTGIKSYQGYDSSTEMIIIAKSLNRPKTRYEFACADITRFSNGIKYNTGICIDVAIHQPDPIEFINQIIRLWDCEKLFFTLLVGPQHEDLYNSTIVSEEYFYNFVSENDIKIEHDSTIDGENFSWKVCSHVIK